jgi:hypothetical protein
MIWLVLSALILADVLRGRGRIAAAALIAVGVEMLVVGAVAFPAYFGALLTIGVCKALGMQISWRIGRLVLISTPHEPLALTAGDE